MTMATSNGKAQNAKQKNDKEKSDPKETEKFLLTSEGVRRPDEATPRDGDEAEAFVVPSDKRRLSGSNLSDDTDETGSSEDTDEPERVVWGRKAEYILSMMGYCVGLGNVWRFPYVCIRNGGGAFLIPFFVCLLVCGMPLYFMEVSLGQFVSKSALHIWGICPLFRGVGIAMNILCLICSWYYIMILAWTLIYIYHSVKSPQPWTLCGQSWNTPACVPPGGRPSQILAGSNISDLFLNGTSGEGLPLNLSVVGTANSTLLNLTVKSSSEEFWK